MNTLSTKLVIFGTSNILSDLLDAAYSVGWSVSTIVVHEAETIEARSVPLQERLARVADVWSVPQVTTLDAFAPGEGESYLLGPTTPRRRHLAELVRQRWGLRFCTLVHRSAYVSPLATLSEGVFVGANSVIAPGAILEEHVFVNRGVTLGHDNRIGAFSRIQPGANLGGLSVYGRGVTVGLGATVLERLCIGDHAVIAGGAVVLADVPAAVMVAGVPATVRKQLVPGHD